MRKLKRTYIIAEAGVNHNGSLDMALELIDVAVEAGVDAVKFQSFKTEKVISRFAPKAEYQTKTTGPDESQYEMVKKLELDETSHRILIDHCAKRGIEFLSTPFDMESVELLTSKFNLPKIKVPSGEITNAPLLLKIAQTKKPLIVSTGMSNLAEIETALGVIAFGYLYSDEERPSIRGFQDAYASVEGQKLLKENVILLHCTTEYPAPFEDVNLRALDTLSYSFGLPVGFSDHTVGISIPIAAVARGAVIIEKHFTLNRELPGPDHKASLEPDELKNMVTSIRQVEQSIGSPLKAAAPSEIKNMSIARKSIVAATEIKEGDVFSNSNLDIKRPGTGISPIYLWEIVGKRSGKNYQKDEVITEWR